MSDYFKLVTEAAYRGVIPDEQLDKMLEIKTEDEVEKIKIFQVIRLDYDYSNETWDSEENVIESHSKFPEALISIAILNKTTPEACKFYINEIEVEQ